MINPVESTLEVKKYLKKLLLVIENDAIFTMINSKIIDKKRIDDILCCVEASWPEDYKNYLAKKGAKKLKSPLYYKQLLMAIKNKFMFSTNNYSVKYKMAKSLISSLIVSIDNDIKHIYNEWKSMF